MEAINRRQLLALAAATAASASTPLAFAQPAAKILVGYPAGGTLDQTARKLADGWRARGRTYIVDNRAGAAGRIASAQLKRETPDGNALLCTHTSALTIYPHVYARLMYDAAADFVPISPVVAATCAFAISSQVPASVTDLAGYLKWAAAQPGGAAYASPAAGSMAHFLGFKLAQAGALKMQHVGYRGSAPAMQDLLGGQIGAYFGFVADFLPYLKSGKLRILGVTGDTRSRFLPEVATFAEQGLAGLRGVESYGIFAPPGTSDAVVQRIHADLVAAAREPAFVSGFEQLGLEVRTMAPQEYARLIQQEREAWRPVVVASGFRSEE